MSWKPAALVEEVEGNCPILRRGHGSRAGRPHSEQTGGGVGVGVQKMSMGAKHARQGGRVRVPGSVQTSRATHKGEMATGGQSRRWRRKATGSIGRPQTRFLQKSVLRA